MHIEVPLRVEDPRGHYIARDVEHGYLEDNDAVTLTAIPVLQPDGQWVGKAGVGWSGDMYAPGEVGYTQRTYPDKHQATQAAMQLARKMGRTYDPRPLKLVRED